MPVIAWLGSAAIGLTWGWYVGLALVPAPRSWRAWLTHGATTALLAATILWLVGPEAAAVFLAGATGGALILAAWRESLRRQATHPQR